MVGAEVRVLGTAEVQAMGTVQEGEDLQGVAACLHIPAGEAIVDPPRIAATLHMLMGIDAAAGAELMHILPLKSKWDFSVRL